MGFEWLKNQVAELIKTASKHQSEIDKIEKVEPKVYNEFQEITPLKLIFLNYVLGIYAPIIKKLSWIKKMYYIDLFAGSGINKMKTTKDTLIGSPFIAILKHREDFDRFFFCEGDKDFSRVLDGRIGRIDLKEYEIKNQDCNLEIDSIMKDIEKESHSFFFIDPYALEFSWESMKKVLLTRSDIIFTFMTPEFFRATTAAIRLPQNKTQKLDTAFGGKSWTQAQNAEELVTIYKNNIRQIRTNAVIESVKIGDKYDLIFITTQTKGNNPWMQGIYKAKKEIEEGGTKEAIRIALDILNKRQESLTRYT